MSKSTVKKALADLDREALQELVLEMYSARKETRDYLEYWADPDQDRELEQIKLKLHKLFYLPGSKPRRKVGASDVKTMLKNYVTLCPEPDRVADLMLYIPDLMLQWLKDRHGIGMVANRKRLYTAVEEAAKYIESAGLEERFGIRLERLRDSLNEFYDSHPESESKYRRRWRWFR